MATVEVVWDYVEVHVYVNDKQVGKHPLDDATNQIIDAVLVVANALGAKIIIRDCRH